MPKRQVGNAFCNFASMTVLASFPNSVDYNREENNREYRHFENREQPGTSTDPAAIALAMLMQSAANTESFGI